MNPVAPVTNTLIIRARYGIHLLKKVLNPSCGFFLSILFLTSCAHELPQTPAAAPFRFNSDHFAFANETVWNYQNGRPVPEGDNVEDGQKKYERHCFVLCRAAVQFWKFGRFEPSSPPLKDPELAARIRQVCERDVWQAPLPNPQRIVFPGYANLFELAQARATVLQENLGLGWPVYFRPGNFCITFPPTRAQEERTWHELQRNLALGYPTILWLVNFPSLSINHAVVVFAQSNKATVFHVYDPNNATTPEQLTYDPGQRTFFFQHTFYFSGGRVNVRPIYLSPWQ